MKMKKMIAMLTCATLVALVAFASAAFAADSPSTVTTDPVTSNGVTLTIQYTGPEDALIIEPTDQKAANVPSGTDPLANFSVRERVPGTITGEDGTIPGGLLLTFGMDDKYAGNAANVYVDHDKGSDEVKKDTVSGKGNVSVNVDRLSIFSLDVDSASSAAGSGSGSAKSADKSTVSPKTGADAATLALAMGIVCIGGAALCFARSRKED